VINKAITLSPALSPQGRGSYRWQFEFFMKSDLKLSFSQSRYLVGGLTLAHAVGLVVVYIVEWPVLLKIPASLAVVASWLFYVRRDALLKPRDSVIVMSLRRDGGVEATTREGVMIVGRQMAGSFVHPWFTTILWRPDGARFSRAVVVMPDSLPADQFRELRVWLKWRWIDGAQDKNL